MAGVVLLIVGGWWLLRSNSDGITAPPAPQFVTTVSSSIAPSPSPPRYETIPLLPPPETLPGVATTTASAGPTVAPYQVRTVDLLALADPARDAIFGTWQRLEGALVSDNAGMWEVGMGASRLALPYRPPAEYDFRIVFTKRSGLHCVSQIFVAHNQTYAWVMGGWGNSVFAFENMRGLHGNEPGNTTRVQQASCLTTGQRYEAVLRVRRDGATALLDGRVISRTPNNYSELTTPQVYHLKNRHGSLGIAIWESQTAFHIVEVIEHSGPGTVLR
jgi:hypothetical protein